MKFHSKMKGRVVSLRDITLVIIADGLHNLPRIKEKLWSTFWEHQLDDDISYSEEYNKKTMKEISDHIGKFIQDMESPADLKVKIVNTVEKMSIQIMKWISYHQNIFSQFKQLPEICKNSLRWSLQGLINKKATAESLVHNQILDITNRFKLACIYCLEADIHILWSQIPESIKNHIQGPQNFYLPELVKLWTLSLTGKLNNLMKNQSDFHDFGFIKAVQSDNEIATMYFWQKLQPKKKEEILINFAEKFSVIWCKRNAYFDIISEYYADIVYFMMSQMNVTQQVNFMKQDLRINRCSTVLSSFLGWPYQNLFIQTANQMWCFLSLDNYTDLLYKITEKIANGENDCNYRNLLREFWDQSPSNHKMSFLKRYANEFLSIYLRNTDNLVSEDVALIVLILKDATSEEKANFNFDFNGKSLCCKLIKNHQWMLVEILTKNCLSSVAQRREFKKDVVMSVSEGSWFMSFINQKKWKELEQFITWCLVYEEDGEDQNQDDVNLYRLEIIKKFYWWCILSVEDINELSIENNFEVLDSLVTWCFSSPEEFVDFKKEMIYNVTKDYSSEILDIISKDKLEVVQSFAAWCLSPVAIDEYKTDLMLTLKVHNAFKFLMFKNGFEWSKKLIEWCFCSEEERNRFKIELVQSMKAETEFHNFIYEDRIEIINDFIIWCLSSADDVYNFKKALFCSVKNGYKMFDLMYKERWYVIERFISWCSSSEAEISLYKTELMYSIKERYNFRQSIYKADFRWIKRIIDWALPLQEAKDKFNVELIHSIKTDQEFLDLLYDGKLDLLDDFISWCLKSKTDIVLLKSELLFSVKGDSRFKDIVFDYKQDFLEELVDWCLSTEEEKIAFKSDLIFSMRNDCRFLDSVYKGKLKQIDLLLLWCLPERAACRFKKELIYEMKEDSTFNTFIYEGKFDLIEKFISFFLVTEKDVQDFKTELITFIRQDGDFKEIIYKREFEWIKNFISLSCSCESIKRTLKMELLHFMKNDECFHDLLYQGRIKVVGGFIAWCLSSDADVHSFKKELIYIMMKLYGFKKLICRKKINLITKIVTWCLTSETEIAKFKLELMKSIEKDLEFTELICLEGFQWVKIFVSWCCKSKEEKDEFKRCLIYFMFEELQLQKLISQENVNLVQELTTWCLPSEEIEAFNKKLFVQ